MSDQFTDYLTNPDYIVSYGYNQKGIVYIENERDYIFWESIFEELHPGKYDLKATFSNDATRGKDILRNIANGLNKYCLAAVDGDFDYICGSFREISNLLQNDYVLHTHCYSRESAILSEDKFDELASKIRLTKKCVLPVREMLRNISETQFEMLVGYLFLLEKNIDLVREFNPHRPLKTIQFRRLINNGFEIDEGVINNLIKNTNALKSLIYEKLDTASAEFRDFIAACEAKGLRPDTAYRFISGHVLSDNIILPIFTRIKFLMQKQSIDEILASGVDGEVKINLISSVRNHYRDNCRLKTIINGLSPCANDEIILRIKSKVSNVH
ncbi:DUF4435 domain-containing protein [Enterobacter hormaechei]|nr:DUF4435 domain-containing protein [Enterobacter hormaechei]